MKSDMLVLQEVHMSVIPFIIMTILAAIGSALLFCQNFVAGLGLAILLSVFVLAMYEITYAIYSQKK